MEWLLKVVSISTLALIVAVTTDTECKELNEYVSHYEGLTYDTHKLHHRAKRSLDDTLNVKFKALGKNFHLRLRRDTSVFSKDLKLELSDGNLEDHDVSYIYEGVVKGEPRSLVHGSVIRGQFDGVIHTSHGTYYVEKAEVYFRENQPFHSVIYHEKHINSDPHRLKRAINTGSCGSSNPDVEKWMNKVQNSAVETETPKISKREVKWDENLFKMNSNSHSNMYSEKQNYAHSKAKRSTEAKQRTCTLFLQSDPFLWKYMTDDRISGAGLGYDSNRALEEITSLFAIHVKASKTIYEGTKFKNGALNYTGFNFVVRRIKIMKYDMCSGSTSKFCIPHIDVTNFLNLNSLINHDEYCLAYVFTYRDFTAGTLGLAWVGSSSRASGGICERWKEYKEANDKVFKSLNTGIVTLVNYGARVLPKVSTLTFAHEIGHNFGSPHDSGSDCTPYTAFRSEDGNYIMFASATSGERPNNSQFSKCSIGNMTLVLDAILNNKNGKFNCFVDSAEAYCGNNIVEGNETCDCGFEEDCTDSCCYGRPSNADPASAEYKRMCTLKPNAKCSPSQGPCCFANCTVKQNNANCLQEASCTEATNCNGVDPTCPIPIPKANGSYCNRDTKICVSGECQGSICNNIGWQQCYLTVPEEASEDYDKGNLCYVACENPSTRECVSSKPGDTARDKPENDPFKVFLRSPKFKDGIQLPPGDPCDNFQGYCDVFSTCRQVDADGPLTRIKNLLFSRETLDSVKEWIVSHWWAVLLISLGLVIFMGIFIKVCEVHTPTHNPKLPPHRKIRLPSQKEHRRQQGPPPGYPVSASNQSASARPPPYNHGNQYEMKQGQPRV